MEREFAILPRQPGAKAHGDGSRFQTRKASFKLFLEENFAALRLLVVLVIAAVYLVVGLRIPTGEDVDKANQFRRVLVEELELKGLANLEIKMKLWSRGRGDIILETTVSPEKLDRIRREFDRLNVAGDYELKVRAP